MSYLATAQRERMYVLGLDTKNVIRFEIELYRGTVASALVRPAEVFQEAVRSCLPGVIVVHGRFPDASIIAAETIDQIVEYRQRVNFGKSQQIRSLAVKKTIDLSSKHVSAHQHHSR